MSKVADQRSGCKSLIRPMFGTKYCVDVIHFLKYIMTEITISKIARGFIVGLTSNEIRDRKIDHYLPMISYEGRTYRKCMGMNIC